MNRKTIAPGRSHLGAAFCLGLAVFAPALSVYERNAGDLASGARELIVPAAAAAAAVLAALLLSMVSRYRPFSLGLILVAATGVMSAWFVFAGPVPPLDGWDRPFVVDRTRAVAELVIFAVIIVSVATLVRRHMTMLFRAVCLAAVLMVVTPLANLAVREHGTQLPSAGAAGRLMPFLELSSEMNILHVMFDSLNTDMFERLLADDLDLKAAFDGFTHYPDHAGYANWTIHSIPALQAGWQLFDRHEPGANVHSEIADRLRGHSVMTDLAGQGYEVSAVQPTEFLCVDMPFHCSAISNLRESLGERKLDTRSLIVTDLVLLRLAPSFLKPLVYNGGRLLLAKLTNVERDIFRSVRLAEALSNRMSVVTDRPVYKFLHFFPPYKVFVLDASCRAGSFRKATWQNYRQQSICTLRLFAKLLERLKHLGVYDDTIIILQADTGSAVVETPSRGVRPASSIVEYTPRQLVAYARPVLAIKGLGSRGQPAVSEHPTSHLSTFELIEAASNGRVDLPAVVDSGVRRFIVSDIARHDSTDIVPFESFVIEGPVSDFANWRYEGLFTRHEQFPGARGQPRN